ncbi:hypothetical protein TBLA_0A02670 [Henningerozyma blattae CBS 6284]|uniref:Pyruvate decarboxylase n=1 Tax=Henningerozyma blattae (strain ATCC 34711 / CBS 6284 / DSM 70876 / NBRC 10599 / NRRL Y-10934 / UCD 77-7) TaxID=1071380 RepID=I2GVB4_HENB6|nr:hypothetical protein TBLA_0A02670 [Tetrapisispora blattae CBS 6284]CCH58066.1 hypothetical protein TBLA_0A02670 [Tetrapisispora blattae CBS 6284]
MAPVSSNLTNTANSYDLQMNDSITFGHYIFQRLLSLGTKSVFGVPGDFNLPLLEYLYDDFQSPDTKEKTSIRWVGGCNELNSAYSADGYSRYTNKISCLITTFGVGELSAINGVSGSFAENIKVLHIVGVPSTKITESPVQKNWNLHHLVPSMDCPNFNPPNHNVYHDMIKDKISCSTHILSDITKAADMVDQVILDIYKYSRPGYLFVPSNFPDMLVSTKNLIDRPTITMDDALALNSIDSNFSLSHMKDLTRRILKILYKSETPAVVCDMLVDRYGGKKLINEFINRTKIRNFVTPLSKSTIDETNENYVGLYNGKQSNAKVIEHFENSDLVLHYGVFSNEVNTGVYSHSYGPNTTLIQLNPTYLRVVEYENGHHSELIYRDVNFLHILKQLLKDIDLSKLNFKYQPLATRVKQETIENSDGKITQASLGQAFPSTFNPGDILVADTGAFQFSIRDFVFHSQMKYITQGFYLSIGMALPCALGVGVAMQDYPLEHVYDKSKLPKNYTPRLILCEGDGAAQMTVQELSTMIREKISIEIYLWNNDGYTIERAIMGPTRSYNDIAAWNWTTLLNSFGDINGKLTNSVTIETQSDLVAKLKDLKEGDNNKCIEFMEVMLGKVDYPPQLQQMVNDQKKGAKK